MTSPNKAAGPPGEPRSRLSPGDVQRVRFARSGLGWRGYEEREVDAFLLRVQSEIGQMIAEKSELRDEVIRLRRDLDNCAQETQASAPRGEEAEVQAVRVLSKAQQTADQYVAEAEEYSRRIALDARQHYEDVVMEARARAAELLSSAQHLAAANGGSAGNGAAVVPEGDREGLEAQVRYLQTFSQVCRVQLRSYLEALLREVEEQWGRADPAVVVNGRPEAAPMLTTALVAGSAEAKEPLNGSA
jgi:DivIVA domain-containing protein